MHSMKLLRPDRLRTIEPPFGWVPFRILTSGFLEKLSAAAMLLYFFLCLVANRWGISFYGAQRIESILRLSNQALNAARNELLQYDLVAFDGRVYQVLSLPNEQQVKSASQSVIGHGNANGPQHIGRILDQLLPRRR